jgi:nucleoside-diphosphate-sugar epimerase
VARFFNVYGPGLDRPGCGRVVSKFLGDLIEDRPMRLVAGGRAVRAYCYIDDAIEALGRLTLLLAGSDRCTGQAFNIGNPRTLTVRELAEAMCRLAGRPTRVVDAGGADVFGAGFEDIEYRCPDLGLMHDLLGYRAGIDLDEGLRRTMAPYGLVAPARPALPLAR